MIQTSEQIAEIAAALGKAAGEIENVAKDRENPHFRAKYATLAGALDEVRPKFAKHGISILQMPINGEGSNIGVTTRLLHSSGQWIESTLFVAPTKFDAQGAGSAITYLRRYSLMAMAGIAPEDDDGNAAVASPQPQRAGMVRAADVPPSGNGPSRPPQNGAANAGTARANGDGSRAQTERGQASSPAGHGPTATTSASRSSDLGGVTPFDEPPLPLNKAALPPSALEPPEVTAARQRIRGLIDKYDRLIKTAPSVHALNLVFEDGQAELREIEAAGEKGKEAAQALRHKFMTRIAQLEEAEAA